MQDHDFDEEVLECFLENQLQLFPSKVAETLEEAENFLADCMAVVVDSVDEVIEFLSGKYRPVEKQLKEEMYAASEALDFEKAAACRDKLKILARITERQKAGFPDLNDKDIFAVAMGEKTAAVQAFFVRKGKLSGAQRFFLDEPGDEAEILESVLKQFYMENYPDIVVEKGSVDGVMTMMIRGEKR